MRAIAEVDPMELAPTEAESDDVLEVWCWLACLGPAALGPDEASFRLSAACPGRSDLVARLVRTDRAELSRDLAGQLADRLARRGSEASRAVAAMMPSLLAADVDGGYAVLRCLAAAATAALARDLSEVLLSLTVAEGSAARRAMAGAGDDAAPLARLRYLVTVLSALDLDAAARARLFLALSQTLEDPDVLQGLVLTSLFPAGSAEGMAVLREGNDDAVRALLEGAARRPRGKAEFYDACRAVMAVGVRSGLPTLARVYRLLNGSAPASASGSAPNLRALASMVRSAALPPLEAATAKRHVAEILPGTADLATLHLLAVVIPGVHEPVRSDLCEYLVAQAGQLLRSARVGMADVEPFVAAVTGASVLHGEPHRMGAGVRRMVLDAAGALRVRMMDAETGAGDAMAGAAFQRIATLLAGEFRRRPALAGALTPVLPLISGLDSSPADLAHA